MQLGTVLLCDACSSAEVRRRTSRAGYTKCRVLGAVVAVGRLDDGHIRTNFCDGDVAEFSDEDVLSLPDHFEPVA